MPNDHLRNSSARNGESINLMEFGALRQRVTEHDDRFDSLEGRIEKNIDSLTRKLDTFIAQYTTDQLLAARAGGIAKGEGRVKRHLVNGAVSIGTSGIFIAILNKVFGLHIGP